MEAAGDSHGNGGRFDLKQIVYIGPTIRGVVRKNQIFTYEPERIMGAAKEVSVYTGYLFVRMDDIVPKRDELRKTGTLLNISYKNVEKEAANV